MTWHVRYSAITRWKWVDSLSISAVFSYKLFYEYNSSTKNAGVRIFQSYSLSAAKRKLILCSAFWTLAMGAGISLSLLDDTMAHRRPPKQRIWSVFLNGENESYRRNRCPFQFMHKYATLVVARQWVTVAVVPRWFTAQWIAALLHEGDGRFVPMQMRGLCLFPVQQWFKGVYHDLMRLPLLVLTNFMGSFLLRQAASQKTDFRSPRIDRDWT